MKCRDCQTKLPEYLAANLLPEDFAILEDHLDHCPSCHHQFTAFVEIERMIKLADLEIPEVDLTAVIMAEVQVINVSNRVAQEIQQVTQARQPKRTWSLLLDLVTAAAAAIIIFWFSGPVFAQHQIPLESGKVVQLSNSVGSVFKTYLGFYDSASEKLFHSINQIDQGFRKGVK